MKLPRVRFTVRRMMVATAIAGLVAGGLRMQRLAAGYRKLAETNANDENFYRVALSGQFKLGHPSYGRIFRGRLDYHQSMRRKYERVARYPFLPVAPDPPEPE